MGVTQAEAATFPGTTVITSIETIENFEPEFNRPASTSVELIYAHSDKWLFGLRSEYNSELEDFPKRQDAVMARYYFVPNFSIGIEYLNSRYRSGATNDDDVEIDEENTLSIEIPSIFSPSLQIENELLRFLDSLCPKGTWRYSWSVPNWFPAD